MFQVIQDQLPNVRSVTNLNLASTFAILSMIFLTLPACIYKPNVQVYGARNVHLNNRPIIGILGMTNNSLGGEYILTSYVKYLESAGAQVVPVRGKQPETYYKTLFKKINGVLLPGGENNRVYDRSAALIYNMAIEANQNGDYFPIWGTCLGFEVILQLTTGMGQDILNKTDTENITLPLTFTQGFEKSRLFQSMPQKLIDILAHENITQNNHQYSLLSKTFHELSLSKFYQVLSTNVDPDNKEFISTIEAKWYPFYATQWHPEKNMYMWATDEAVEHSYHAVEMSQYMANFFVNEARKNQHHFPSHVSEASSVIQNYKVVYYPSYRSGARYVYKYDK